MTSRRKRLNLVISAELYGFITDFADAEDCTATEVIRRGLSVLKAFKQQQAIGRCHLGVVKDSKKLDAEFIGVINN